MGNPGRGGFGFGKNWCFYALIKMKVTQNAFKYTSSSQLLLVIIFQHPENRECGIPMCYVDHKVEDDYAHDYRGDDAESFKNANYILTRAR